MVKKKSVKNETVKREPKRNQIHLIPDQASIERLFSDSDKAQKEFFSSPDPDEIRQILAQRHSHRGKLFNHSVTWVWIHMIIFILIITTTIIFKFMHPNKTFFESASFIGIVASMSGQVVGIVYIIAKSIWDDRKYLDYLDNKNKPKPRKKKKK